MNALDLIEYIRSNGMSLSLMGNNIKISPHSMLTDDIRNLIRHHKRLLLTILRHKQAEIKKLIMQVSMNYGGDQEQFLLEYINDVVTHCDIEKTLACSRDLAKQFPPVNNRK